MATNGNSTTHHPLSSIRAHSRPPCTPDTDPHSKGYGSPPRNSAQAWSPAALLQPNRSNGPPVVTIPSSPSSASQQASPVAAVPQRPQPQPVVFQFTDGSEASPSANTSSDASTPAAVSDAASNGGVRPGNWVERVHNVQARSEVPEPKRRRVDIDGGAQNAKSIPVRASSSGILGQYARDNRPSTASTMSSIPNSPTVDLTSGKPASTSSQFA